MFWLTWICSALCTLQEKNIPVPQLKKPYSTDILPYLMKGHYFNGPKSVGTKFSDRFREIAQNKAQQPKVMIAMVALTSTSVYFLLIYSNLFMY